MQTIASSCTEECADNPNCGNAVIAGTGTDTGEVHVYGNACIIKLLADPDSDIRLHGTHELTDEQLAEVYSTGIYAGNEGDWWREIDSRWYGNAGMILHTLADGDDSEYIAAATTNETPDGELVVLSAALLRHLLANPAEMHARGYVFYGTHVLPAAWLADLFPAEEIVTSS